MQNAYAAQLQPSHFQQGVGGAISAAISQLSEGATADDMHVSTCTHTHIQTHTHTHTQYALLLRLARATEAATPATDACLTSCVCGVYVVCHVRHVSQALYQWYQDETGGGATGETSQARTPAPPAATPAPTQTQPTTQGKTTTQGKRTGRTRKPIQPLPGAQHTRTHLRTHTQPRHSSF